MTSAPPPSPLEASSASIDTARHRSGSAGRLWPWMVLVVGGVFSVWMYLELERAAARRGEEFFRERIAEAEAGFRVQITHYIDALRGGASFFGAVKAIDRDQWRAYAESLQMRQRYPGIFGLGVILAVAPDQVEAWQQRVWHEGEPPPEIRPFPATAAGPADDFKYLITYAEGNNTARPSIGRDIATEPSRRRAAELARDTGQPQINQRIPGSRDTQRRAGLLLYVPLYRESAPLATVADRRAAHLGWVYAQVFPDVFLASVLKPMGDVLRLHFFEDGGLIPEKLLYAPEGESGALPPNFERLNEMMLAGQRFHLGWNRGPGFPQESSTPAGLVAGSLVAATLFLSGLVASLQSIGRRANAIAAARTADLATSEERFRQAFDAAGIGMALVGLDGQFLRVNQSLCEIVGYPESKLLRKRFQDITHPDDLAADLTLLRELIDDRQRFNQLEKRYIHHDGNAVPIRLTVSLVRDAQGAPVHFIAQIEDITETKRLAQHLARTRDEAVESSRLKSEFLTAMVHEISAPMNELGGAARRLREAALSPAQAEDVRTIESSASTLLMLSHDILDYSRIEAGEIVLAETAFNVRACVDEVLALFEERARRSRIELATTVADRVPSQATGDPKRLQQILVHLMNVALNATSAGEVRVNLTAEALDATTGLQRLKFAVRDTGAGIPPDLLDRLFKPFSSVGEAPRSLGVAGMGLAISRRLAEVMGGTMWAQSEIGRGSTFHFTVLVRPRDTA